MKALFDPLVLKKVVLATPGRDFRQWRRRWPSTTRRSSAVDDADRKAGRPVSDEALRRARRDADARRAGHDPQAGKGSAPPAEQKIADDYFPVLRIDPSKIKAGMPPEDRSGQVSPICWRSRRRCVLAPELPSYWTVEEDSARLKETELCADHGRSEAAGEGQAGCTRAFLSSRPMWISAKAAAKDLSTG